MIASQGIGLSSGQPAVTFQASSVRLDAIREACVENAGPGAVIVFPGGTAQGAPLATIGRGQRKVFATGGVDAITFATNANQITFFGATPPVTVAIVLLADKIEIPGTERRDGAGVYIAINHFPVGTVLATSFGFDKIRGLFFVHAGAIANPFKLVDDFGMTFDTPSSGAGYMVLSTSAAGIQVDGAAGLTDPVFLSDSPLAFGSG